MWENPIHRQAVICESRVGNQFVKFVNMLMNDTTFLLDECLENLKRIHQTQQLLSDKANLSKMSAEQQQSRLTQLATRLTRNPKIISNSIGGKFGGLYFLSPSPGQ